MQNSCFNRDMRNNSYEPKKRSVVPDKFVSAFNILLEELERETGILYSVSVHETGSYKPLVIKPFERRRKYIVCDMKSEYKELEGEYNSIYEIKKKIIELKYGNLLTSDIAWHSFKKDDQNYEEYDNGNFFGQWRCPECNNETNYVGNELCQLRKETNGICSYRHNSIWNDVEFDLKTQLVYSSFGPTIPMLKKIGRIVCEN